MSAPAPGKRAAAHLLQGEIHSGTIPPLFHELGSRRATGLLTVAGRTVRKTLLLKEGRVQFATSNDREDRFNQTLMRYGVVSLGDLVRALEMALSSRDRLGEVMVRLGILGAADVEKWVRVQVHEIALGVFERTSGAWRFEPGPVAVESIRLDLPADVLVLEGIRRIRSWARIYEEVGGLNTEYLATRDVETIAATLRIEPAERKLLEMCRNPTSLGEMCAVFDREDLSVCRAVWALLCVGALIKS